MVEQSQAPWRPPRFLVLTACRRTSLTSFCARARSSSALNSMMHLWRSKMRCWRASRRMMKTVRARIYRRWRPNCSGTKNRRIYSIRTWNDSLCPWLKRCVRRFLRAAVCPWYLWRASCTCIPRCVATRSCLAFSLTKCARCPCSSTPSSDSRVRRGSACTCCCCGCRRWCLSLSRWTAARRLRRSAFTASVPGSCLGQARSAMLRVSC